MDSSPLNYFYNFIFLLKVNIYIYILTHFIFSQIKGYGIVIIFSNQSRKI